MWTTGRGACARSALYWLRPWETTWFLQRKCGICKLFFATVCRGNYFECIRQVAARYKFVDRSRGFQLILAKMYEFFKLLSLCSKPILFFCVQINRISQVLVQIYISVLRRHVQSLLSPRSLSTDVFISDRSCIMRLNIKESDSLFGTFGINETIITESFVERIFSYAVTILTS